MTEQQQWEKEELDNGEDLKNLLYKYFQYWPWFVLGVVLSVAAAFLYLRYSTEVYSTQAKIKVLDESNDGGLDLSGLSGATSMFNLSKVNLENEIQIVKSRRMFGKVVEVLDLNTVYYSNATFKSSLYFNPDMPIKISWMESDVSSSEPPPLIEFTSVNQNTFKLREEVLGELKAKYGDTLAYGAYKLVVEKNPLYVPSKKESEVTDFLFKYVSTDNAIRSLSESILVEPVGDKSHVLTTSINGSNINRNEAILNELIKQFNQDGIEDKRLISKRTQEFVEDRLVFLVQDLDTVEKEMVTYKNDKDLIDVEANAKQLFGKEAEAEKKRFEMQTQLAVTQDFQSVLKDQDDLELLPANIGIKDASVNQLTGEYNQLILERDRLLVSATAENPAVLGLNQELSRLQNNINASVKAYLQSLQITLSSLEQQESFSSGKLGGLPQIEKEVRSITRQREIKERLYLFLLQKREEAALSYAITAPTIKVVDFAYTSPFPVSPKKKIVLLAALILGLLIPFGILYVIFLLDTKVNSKSQIQKKITNISVVGEIPQLPKSSKSVIETNDRSVLAEAFRILRTNLNYFKSPSSTSDKAQVVFVTSTTKGEGKTFVAVNLANTLASAKKKTLLVGCDLRNPQIHNYINKDKNEKGMSSFLNNASVEFEGLLIKSKFSFENLDVMLSGPIPPNPAELLLNGRFEEFIEEAKSKYDYVIIDTAPTVLVTDTLLISQYADATMYMIRAGYTDVKLLNHIEELQKQKKLKNMGIVLNGVKEDGAYGYNYGYGYGYSEDIKKTPRWKFWAK
ncbi:GumC family protein [Mesonia ostreae]|uniref:non-specific protein-tyrosine kinase n=1 Tax=Mesonia ostreae TaxID=861110 RepID=A0ABU2KHE4_9FLAO|nr:polysaccharide biosynthesis tyrosine autokinase [Mesonia ostreae]MDT0294083.1 polysaccharide biosynthesis tyrosine autokinase [Mesonia ostreae]